MLKRFGAVVRKLRPGTTRRVRRAVLSPVEGLEGRALLSHTPLHPHSMTALERHSRGGYAQTNLVTDDPAVNPAAHTDTNLTNPWGLAFSPTGPFWVADNHSGKATLYDGAGFAQSLVVTIPPPAGSPAGTVAAPTGQVFNPTADFAVPGGGASHFLYSTEDGTIAAWGSGTDAALAVDNSASGAVYKGLALAPDGGVNFLYATNFHSGKVDVFDRNFAPVTLAPGAFHDPRVPAGYAPFGISTVGSNLVVTFAMQDAEKHDDAHGPHRGFVDVFDPSGRLVVRVASRGALNSPWGVAQAPASFGRLGNDLLVGNFGDGRVNAYKLVGHGRRAHYRFDGRLADASRRPITIDGLWALAFGNGAAAGRRNTLYFTAGPRGEQDGLFGGLSSAS